MYLYNTKRKDGPYHNLDHLTERCNTDQINIMDRDHTAEPPKGRKPCKLCNKKPVDVG